MKPSLNCPSRQDVELAIRQLEIEDEREKQAIRNFWARQREDQVRALSLKWKLTAISGGILIGCFFLYYLLDAILRWMGL